MTYSPRRTVITAATAAVVVALTGCASPFPDIQFTPKETTIPTGQANVPYPANLNHLGDILALGKTTLPEGAINITITPATKFAESYPEGWGHIIAYRTQSQPIRDHICAYTSRSRNGIEDYPDTEYLTYMKDVDFTAIQHPWVTGLGRVQLVVERPLSRCWLLIRGAPR